MAASDEQAEAGPPRHEQQEQMDAGPTRPEQEDVEAGPELPKPKRRKVLEHEEQYMRLLPLSDMYEKSYMHRDTVVDVAVAAAPGFLITASADGYVKFWKKQATVVEFAKQYKAHLGPVTGLVVSADGSLCASISTDRSVKVRSCCRV